MWKLKNVCLYAKNHYQKSDNIWEDLKKMLELDDYITFNSNDIYQIIRNEVQTYILEAKSNQNYKITAFLDGLNPSECWKIGYYTKDYVYKNEEKETLSNYNYEEATIRSALSLIRFASKEDLGWEEWIKSNPDVLPKIKEKV